MAQWTTHWLLQPRYALRDDSKPHIDLFLYLVLKLTQVYVLRATCDALYGDDHIKEAIACFQRMKSKLAEDNGASFHGEEVHWELGEWLPGQ